MKIVGTVLLYVAAIFAGFIAAIFELAAKSK
jgi:hypothetical protein